MKTAILLLFVLMNATNSYTQVAAKELLIKSYQQAALSQQITKNYVSIVLKIDKKENRIKLQNDALAFSDELEELEIGLISIGLQGQLAKLQTAWFEYKAVLFGGGYTKKKITELAKANVKLLEASEEVSKVLARAVERQGSKMLTEEYDDLQILKMVGEQSIYAHTIPTYYMLKTVGLKHQLCEQPYHKCIINYENNLQKIIPIADTHKQLTETVTTNLLYWSALEKICTKLKIESESIDEFNPLLQASTGLATTNQLLLNEILRLSYE